MYFVLIVLTDVEMVLKTNKLFVKYNVSVSI